MENRDYIVGLDIGSSKVVMAVGTRDEESKAISVLGVEVQEIDGCVKDGDVVNFLDLGDAIIKAKKALEMELGRQINSAYVGISGRSVYCVRYEDYVEIDSKMGCVTEKEMRELHSRIEMVVSGGGDEIVERIPLRYVIDDNQEVKNPVGAFGRKLSATYLFVMVGKQQIDRVNRALYRAEISSCGLCVNPTLLPRTLLSKEESEEGVVIVDVGSDLTDISVVREGKLWFFSSLPIGASSINNDLYDFLRTTKRDIESVKRRYGSATADGVPENTTVPIKTAGHAKKQILQRNIAEIAEERLKDIAGFVARELKGAKLSTKVPCGAVLTGGSAYLSNMEQLFARELQMEVRLGTTLNGLDYESQGLVSAYPQSVVVALLLYGAEHNACTTSSKVTLPMDKPNRVEREKVEEERAPSGVDIFSAPQPLVEEVKPQPTKLVEETPVEESEMPTEELHEEPVVAPVDEKVEESAADVEHKEEKKPELKQSEKREEKKSKWTDRFRNWLDDMFTNDNDYL